MNQVKQSPQYSLGAIREGVYVIGMKEQFNIHDIAQHPLQPHLRYIADEMGFVLFNAEDNNVTSKSLDNFGPYCIEQYILMEVLSKHEVAQNVMEYYVNNKEKLEAALGSYSEAQGQGFICWRFINERRAQS